MRLAGMKSSGIGSMSRLFVCAGLLACTAGLAVPQSSHAVESPKQDPNIETKAQRDAKMKWWREARFGMFIHWGLYSVAAGTWNGVQRPDLGEWIMSNNTIPVADYEKLAARFNPTEFDAEKWVLTAKNAGMKYIVITSKHHEGFAMFRSKASKFSIYDATPFKRDPLMELAAACKKHGIKLGFYYSQAQDWHHPGGGSYGAHWDPAQNGDINDYISSIAVPQVREILSNYGKISILWWDTPLKSISKESIDKLQALTKLQPGIITNNRLGGDVPGDTETPEQYVPARGLPGDWETCMTVNDTWGYKSFDNNWKSTETLIRTLIDVASKGGNYLLNVGPTAEGAFPEPILERFDAIGKWMKVNGEAIYGTSATPFSKMLPWGRCTKKGGKLYLHVFDWPSDGVLRVPLANDARKAYLLAEPKTALHCAKADGAISISLPKTAPDRIASVVVLEVRGEPKENWPPLHARTNQSVVLLPSFCLVHGHTLQLESGGSGYEIRCWTKQSEYVGWDVDFEKGGAYDVSLEYSQAPNSAGSELVLECGGKSLGIKPRATSGWEDYMVKDFGRVEVPDAGRMILTLRASAMPSAAIINLRRITLRPVGVK